jgi:GntR family transcriptional regulator
MSCSPLYLRYLQYFHYPHCHVSLFAGKVRRYAARGTPPRAKVSGVQVVDKRSPVPLSEQLAAVIRAEITSGRYAPGQVLPSELALIELHSVSRNTVRRAYKLLKDEGLVTSLPSRSYIVA